MLRGAQVRVADAAATRAGAGRIRRIHAPRDLAQVTRIEDAAEAAPADAGMTASGVRDIWAAVERLYRLGLHPVISMEVRRHGVTVLRRAIGGFDGQQATPDTPVCLFSASKAVTALLVHRLAEDGRLQLDDRVVDYVPEFAPHGKDRVTIRQLLSHRAGIPMIPAKKADPRLLYQWDEVVQLLCQAKPFNARFERQAYHAITGGFIIGELVQRVAGMPLREALARWITRPLGLRHLDFGVPESLDQCTPPHVFTGPRPSWPFTMIARRILGAPFERCVEVSNEAAFRRAVIPAGNIYATAPDAARLFQMLLNGGVLDGARIFRPDTLEEAVQPASRIQFDSTLIVPIRFSAGFMLGEKPFGLFGPDSTHAFGHLGFMNILCWADPQRDLVVSFLNTGKSLAPSMLPRLAGVVRAIARACPPLPGFRARGA